MSKTIDESLKKAQKKADKLNRKRQKYGTYRQRVRERGGNDTCYYPVKPCWKTVDYIDLCRYDKEFIYAVEVRVKKDGFALGRKGDYLRFCVSEYGMARLQSDELDGIIDITSNGAVITGFAFPDVSDVYDRIKELEDTFRDVASRGEPLPECIRKLIDD